VRILFLCHRIPFPPDKGDKIRAFHELRALAAHHEVDLFTLVDDPADLAHREALDQVCRRVTIERIYPKLARIRSLPSVVTRTPLTLPYFYSAKLHRQISQAVATRGYDRVFVYCSAMAQYVDHTQQALGGNTGSTAPMIVDLVDVDSNKWAQYADATHIPFSTVFRKEARDLRSYERRVCQTASCVIVSTEREAQLAREIAPGAAINVLSNGVDAAHFQPGSRQPAGPPTIAFTGDMGYFPNQEGAIFFAREVLPLIHLQMPGVRFVVVGRRPDRRVEQLATLPHVQVTGSVPDVRPWLTQASVAVVPLRIAAGIQNKILEAMASGLPVVATSLARSGLTPAVAELVEAGDTPEALADKTLEFLRNPELATLRGVTGRRRVSAEYSWERTTEKLLRLLENPTPPNPDGNGAVATNGGVDLTPVSIT